MDTMTREEARAVGLDRYCTGDLCKHGHLCERRTSDAHCIECRRVRVKKSRRTVAGKLRKARQESRHRATAHGKLVLQKAVAKWRENNVETHKSHGHARRARKQNAEGRYTAQDIDLLLLKQHNRCVGCRVSFNLTKHTVDHIVPLSKGGSNWSSNLQLLCGPCNDSKGAKFMCDWVRPIKVVAWAIH